MQLRYVKCCPGNLHLEKVIVSQLYLLRLCFLTVKDAWQKSQPWSVAEIYVRLCWDRDSCIVTGNCSGEKEEENKPLILYEACVARCSLHHQCDKASLDCIWGFVVWLTAHYGFIIRYQCQESVNKNNRGKSSPQKLMRHQEIALETGAHEGTNPGIPSFSSSGRSRSLASLLCC